MYLLDTNVLSELRKLDHPRTDSAFVEWVGRERGIERFHLATVNVFEVEVGIERIGFRDPRQGNILRRWLEEYVLVDFAPRLHVFDVAAARTTARLAVKRTLPPFDAMIAGVAKSRGLTVATRNIKHFDDLGIPLVNPWDSSTWR